MVAAQQHELKAFVTEFGGSNTTDCHAMLDEMLDYMANNTEYIGWTAWSAGTWLLPALPATPTP